MDIIVKVFTDNYQWIFSGVGVAVIVFFLSKTRKDGSAKTDKTTTTQIGNKVGGDQAGRDIKK
jgi:hypothetical protein